MRGHIFNKKENREKMVRCYNLGVSITKIATMFNCHYSTILHWKQRLNLYRPFRAKRPKQKPPQPHFIYPKYDYEVKEERNQGKLYKQYLKEKGLELKHNHYGDYAVKQDDHRKDLHTS